MPKKIDRSAHIGDAGIALIHRRVSEMGYVWREKGKDAGVDVSIRKCCDGGCGGSRGQRLLLRRAGCVICR